ncbi:RrF2 family transcriptional regulator [Fusobacterium ulcerans]|uniref:RrF2 family transcriptional regulator n=1 Tax=Fusobacterium ulcerans TaxID=861 RepID=UPI001D0B47B7|nr:Rrf2 family transcriptional regulator [Fusobacterium ulcerans]MCB8564519.1 Rrf2 family transcriptional regulator [Fusobacterium ulcerans]MCB8648690.1 Rrf2 family transcriptional regulator [Fusobacterium ulcerans]
MKLIQESMNGIRLVKYLANLKKGEIANAKDISREVGVPVKFALKILRILRKNKIIESYRGITGGYELRKEEVSVYEIIKVLQGDLYISNDFKEKKEPIDEIDIELKKIQEDVIVKLKHLKIQKKL